MDQRLSIKLTIDGDGNLLPIDTSNYEEWGSDAQYHAVIERVLDYDGNVVTGRTTEVEDSVKTLNFDFSTAPKYNWPTENTNYTLEKPLSCRYPIDNTDYTFYFDRIYSSAPKLLSCWQNNGELRITTYEWLELPKISGYLLSSIELSINTDWNNWGLLVKSTPKSGIAPDIVTTWNDVVAGTTLTATLSNITKDNNICILAPGDSDTIYIQKIKLVYVKDEPKNVYDRLRTEEPLDLKNDGYFVYQKLIVPTEGHAGENEYYYKDGQLYLNGTKVTFDEVWDNKGHTNNIFWFDDKLFTIYNLVECFVLTERDRLNELFKNGCRLGCDTSYNALNADFLAIVLFVLKHYIDIGEYTEAHRLLSKLETCNGLCKRVKKQLKGCGCDEKDI